MKLTFELNKTFQRPVILFETHFSPQGETKHAGKLSALLDTGAQMPVWVADSRTLEAMGGIKVLENAPITGFGGTAYGTLYRLADFRVGSLIYPSFPIIAARLTGKPSFHMILSATMFSGLVYEVDDVRHKFTVTIPQYESTSRRLEVQDSLGRLHVLTGNAD